jgi:Ca-activated chloride channel family protein
MHLGSVIVAPKLGPPSPRLWRARRRRAPTALAAALVASAGVISGSAQFSTGTELVEVYVSVSDSAGRPVTGLPRDAFTVREDGVAQSVTTFAAGTMPLALGVAVDRSFSMAGRPLATAKAGAVRLLDALQPGDRTMLVAVGSQVETLVPLSAERRRARDVVTSLMPWGTSPLGDATIAAIAQVAEGPGRRALALFTDGRERYNETERTAVLDRVRRGRVLVYPVAVGGTPTPLLVDLAVASGGRAFPARDDREAVRAAEAVADDLRHQYLLGYAPRRPLDQGAEAWRSIRVTVSRPEVTVRARDGYFAGQRPAGAASRHPVASKSQGCHGEGTGERARIRGFSATSAGRWRSG